ncbi:MAG TPA: fumarylacetoacetate hydrolase family protein [Candidatus Binataceae bacterium]|nr:fumarylacetoacetate hydrolase family protein [Candidatus Binataceae bacterium]
MKIVVYGPDRRTGAVQDGSVVDLSYAFAKCVRECDNEPHPLQLAEALVPSDLARLIEAGQPALDRINQAVDYLQRASDQLDPRGEPVVHKLSAVRLHAPRPHASRVACAGGNFADHAIAMAAKIRGQTISASDAKAEIRKAGIWGFWKVDRRSMGPEAELIYPARARYFDYEGEAAVVLGKQGKNIKAADAKSYIWGVTLSGDWSIRGLNEGGGLLKFAMQKNFDTSHSMGPCIVVGELDPDNVEVETLVNGDRRQHYNTKDMVVSFAEYIEYLSTDLTLYPGDVISGGTAAGTAADSSEVRPDRSFAPDRFLKPGDTVEIRSPAIGSLKSRVVASR